MDNVSISSESTSGSIALRVPFEGSIKVKSHSGSIAVEGKGVTIEKDIQSGSQKIVEARRGKGKGRIDISTTSGSIKIIVD